MNKKINILILVIMILVGCTKTNDPSIAKEQKITNGTCVLLFPMWTNSSSAFERTVYSNYFVVYSNKAWYVREMQTNGTLAVFWKSDSPNKNIQDARDGFYLNIQWTVYKTMYDSFKK